MKLRFDRSGFQFFQISGKCGFKLSIDLFLFALANQRLFAIADAEYKISIRLLLKHDPDACAFFGQAVNRFIHIRILVVFRFIRLDLCFGQNFSIMCSFPVLCCKSVAAIEVDLRVLFVSFR